jgi:acyl-CoA thioester hydrolase
MVFYANYLMYFERGRTEWLGGLGLSQETLRRDEAAVFVVSDTTVRYPRPARLDDEVVVTVRLAESGKASLVIDQQALRGDEVLAEGRIGIGCVDAQTLRPRRIPSNLLASIGLA